MAGKVRIAHLAGPSATIQNTPPLVTSNKARRKHGLPPLTGADGTALPYDALRGQRLAAPARVFVEQFSAHPLEADAAALYAPPDGYIGADGSFGTERRSPDDKPVYEIEMSPEDGLYPLPYMARQADGAAWEEECASPGAPDEQARQGFYPDGSRSFEEIDRLMVDDAGIASAISALADVDFYRGVPPGGYRGGLAEAERSDIGDGDIPAERRGADFFPYKPYHLAAPPPRPTLAKATNDMQALVSNADYDGVIWTQGSPDVEDSAYWFNLLIDTAKPICGVAAQRPQGQISNDGPANIVDCVRYIASRVWADADGRDRCGAVVIQEQQIFAAREVAKVDARPGGYVATGGHGGIIGQVHYTGRFMLTYLPVYRHTGGSEVNLSRLPSSTTAVRGRRRRADRALRHRGQGRRRQSAGGRDPGGLDRQERLLCRARDRRRPGAGTGSCRFGRAQALARPARGFRGRGSGSLRPQHLGRPGLGSLKGDRLRHPGRAGRARPHPGFRRLQRLPDLGRQSDGDQGAAPADGLPAALRLAAAGRRPGQPDRSRARRDPGRAGALPGGVRHPLTGQAIETFHAPQTWIVWPAT